MKQANGTLLDENLCDDMTVQFDLNNQSVSQRTFVYLTSSCVLHTFSCSVRRLALTLDVQLRGVCRGVFVVHQTQNNAVECSVQCVMVYPMFIVKDTLFFRDSFVYLTHQVHDKAYNTLVHR